jgi:uncharacterized protein YcbK (DUF882 family)
MRSTLETTNDDLRRLRKELARSGREPLRIVITGDPVKPLLTITIPRRLLTILGTVTAICAVAGPIVGWGKPARAFGALSNALAPSIDNPDVAAVEPLPEMASSSPLLTPKFQADAVPDGKHFTVEISNTGKMIKVKLGGPAGEPVEESYRDLRHELRCQRTGAESPIDPRLIELLYEIAVHSNSHIQVVSAFRAPQTPREHNYHTGGMAADIRVPGLTTIELRDLAKSLGARGVGYYPTVQFVHVDVRTQPYFWTDISGHNEPSREIDERALPDSASELADPAAPEPAMLEPGAPLIEAAPAASATSPLGSPGVSPARSRPSVKSLDP